MGSPNIDESRVSKSHVGVCLSAPIGSIFLGDGKIKPPGVL